MGDGIGRMGFHGWGTAGLKARVGRQALLSGFCFDISFKTASLRRATWVGRTTSPQVTYLWTLKRILSLLRFIMNGNVLVQVLVTSVPLHPCGGSTCLPDRLPGLEFAAGCLWMNPTSLDEILLGVPKHSGLWTFPISQLLEQRDYSQVSGIQDLPSPSSTMQSPSNNRIETGGIRPSSAPHPGSSAPPRCARGTPSRRHLRPAATPQKAPLFAEAWDRRRVAPGSILTRCRALIPWKRGAFSRPLRRAGHPGTEWNKGGKSPIVESTPRHCSSAIRGFVRSRVGTQIEPQMDGSATSACRTGPGVCGRGACGLVGWRGDLTYYYTWMLGLLLLTFAAS
jgi:hypothetical protein